MNNADKTFFTLAIIFLVVIVMLLPLRMLLFNEDYYYSQFEKNNVDVDDKEVILENTLLFFKDKAELDYFSDDENSHLEDVKVLFNRLFFVLYASILLFFASLVTLYYLNKQRFHENVPKVLFIGGLSSLALLILLSLASVNFSATFGSFHQIFFPQGNFNFPESSLLITIFPQAFFKSFFIRLLLNSIVLSMVLMIPQFIINKRKK